MLKLQYKTYGQGLAWVIRTGRSFSKIRENSPRILAICMNYIGINFSIDHFEINV
jgi:hypothetical protein